ncbi:MAG: NUDIX hydrolase [Gammaproteobacteria bacterium]|nr:NUDIX hydrolase [Gammaproteobacteria bacterium]
MTMRDEDLIWERLGSERGPEMPLFRARLDLMCNRATAKQQECLVLESPDWVNVVAVTPDRRVVMVEQYRFGSGEVGLEPPAGIVDTSESVMDAAKRELLEETGYASEQWRYLGCVQPNPAFHDNLCHHWLAEDVESMQPPTPDPGEVLRIRLMTPDELRAEIVAGRLKHTLAQSALSRVFRLWDLVDLGDD